MDWRVGFLVAVVTGVCCGALGVLAGWLLWGYQDKPDDGELTMEFISVERDLMEGIKAENIDKNLKLISSQTRVAGMAGGESMAQYMKTTWQEQGMDMAGVDTYDVLLSYPAHPERPNRVEILDADGHVLFSSAEQDTLGWEGDDLRPYCAYSKSGHVEGELVYANYATESDFEMLWKNYSINVRGKIVLARQGWTPSYEKAKLASEHGASGLILYMDPFKVARNVTTYPEGRGLPNRAAFWNTLHSASGDPLTPGYPATKFASRPIKKSWNSVESPIPVHGVSYRVAQELFNSISVYSPRIPETYQWRDWEATGLAEATFNYTMHLGPLMHAGRSVKLTVRNKLHMRPIYNAFAMIKGDIEPDRFVMVGNHRDAWGKGAVDAAGSTATMLELTRVIGQLLQKGWRPRRTILFCSWDAEEFGLIGSTEFVEDKLHLLQQRAVAYINMDVSVSGTPILDVSASPLLNSLIFDSLKKVPHPKAANVYEAWKQSSFLETPTVRQLHPNSDHTAFYFMAGVPSLTLYYTNDRFNTYPTYHTGIDTYEYVKRFIDPNFEYHQVIGKVIGEITRDLADSATLPLSVKDYAWKVRSRLSMFQEQTLGAYKWFSTKKGQRMIEQLEDAWTNFVYGASQFYEEQQSLNSTSSDLKIRSVNDKLMQLERTFIDPQWRLNDKPYHHVLFSPSLHCCAGIYEALTDPAVQPFLNDDTLPDEAYHILQKQFAVLAHTFYSATNLMLAY